MALVIARNGHVIVAASYGNQSLQAELICPKLLRCGRIRLTTVVKMVSHLNE